MARYYEENALIEFVKQYTPTIEGETTLECVERAIRNAPTADVVPRAELEHTLSDIKRQIHDKAVYPEARSVKPYISLKVVDAIINNKMEEFGNEK